MYELTYNLKCIKLHFIKIIIYNFIYNVRIYKAKISIICKKIM